jgi:hypothetical protein
MAGVRPAIDKISRRPLNRMAGWVIDVLSPAKALPTGAGD